MYLRYIFPKGIHERPDRRYADVYIGIHTSTYRLLGGSVTMDGKIYIL